MPALSAKEMKETDGAVFPAAVWGGMMLEEG